MKNDIQIKPSTPPSEKLLKEVFSQVMEDWAKLIPREAEQLQKTPSGAAIERKVILSGQGVFHLVVRVPGVFGLIMGRLFDPGNEAVNPEDAFSEVVSMYCGHLKDALWGAEAPYTPYLPAASTSSDWPSPKPDISCFLRIGAYPVEIMLWDLSAQDKK